MSRGPSGHAATIRIKESNRQRRWWVQGLLCAKRLQRIYLCCPPRWNVGRGKRGGDLLAELGDLVHARALDHLQLEQRDGRPHLGPHHRGFHAERLQRVLEPRGLLLDRALVGARRRQCDSRARRSARSRRFRIKLWNGSWATVKTH